MEKLFTLTSAIGDAAPVGVGHTINIVAHASVRCVPLMVGLQPGLDKVFKVLEIRAARELLTTAEIEPGRWQCGPSLVAKLRPGEMFHVEVRNDSEHPHHFYADVLGDQYAELSVMRKTSRLQRCESKR
ncbi:MAG: hypothetical protein JRD89_02475 [Deltaproteobacteria bacterium]|nr:hypothetical protein [Deltaproteobacteria bacterium]